MATRGREIRKLPKLPKLLLLYRTLHPLAGLGLLNNYPIGEVTAARGTAHSAHLNLPLPGGRGCTGTSEGIAVPLYVPLAQVRFICPSASEKWRM